MGAKFFTAAWLVTAALLSSWAVSSASDEARVDRFMPSQARGREMPSEAIEVAAQTARLAARLRHAPRGVLTTGRNPFVLSPEPGAAPVRRMTVTKRADSHASAREGDAPVGLRADVARADAPALAAVAEIAGGATTAVISFRGELHYASRGAVIADRYRIDAISGDGVDIFDLSLGTHSHLTLRQAR